MDSMQPVYAIFGAIVKANRRRLGLTQAQLAERLTLSRASIANIESGAQRVLLHDLYDIAAALSIDPQELFVKPKITTTVSFQWPDLTARYDHADDAIDMTTPANKTDGE